MINDMFLVQVCQRWFINSAIIYVKIGEWVLELHLFNLITAPNFYWLRAQSEGPQPIKSAQVVLGYKWSFMPNLKKFLPSIPEISWIWGHSDFNCWPAVNRQFILESKWRFMPNILKINESCATLTLVWDDLWPIANKIYWLRVTVHNKAPALQFCLLNAYFSVKETFTCLSSQHSYISLLWL